MPRKNTAAHGRRRQAKPPGPVIETDRLSPGEMARRLVDRGLATAAILDQPPSTTPTERNRR